MKGKTCANGSPSQAVLSGTTLLQHRDKLREFIASHLVRWSVQPVGEILRAGVRVNVGFELELVATHGILPRSPAPGCRECQKLFLSLTELADEILPREKRQSRYEIYPYDHSFHLDPHHALRPEVVLKIRVSHRNDYFEPIDACEEKCLKEMEASLKSLGARKE